MDPTQKIAELKELVRTIERGKLMWEATFDVISDPVMIVDRGYRIQRANKALARACGMDVRQIAGRTCHEVFAGYNAPCPRCPVQQTLSENESCGVELDMFPRMHQYFVNAYRMLCFDQESEEAIVLHYRDVTGEKQLHKKLMHSEKMAALGTLAGGIAHEINNPLAGILAFVQLVMRQLGENHPSTDDLKEIEAAAVRCKKIVAHLLDFSRQDITEKKEDIQLAHVIKKSLSFIRLQAKQYQAEVKWHVSDDLPLIHGEVTQMEQVILNLTSNALHAMENRQGTLTISAFSDAQKSYVNLQIKDTGEGIEKRLIDRIFDPYFTTKDQGKGTGLGLAICYKIIQEHGGRVDVQSEVGQGATVTVRFPAVHRKEHA